MKFRCLALLLLIGSTVLLTPSSELSAQSGTIHFVIGTAPGGAIDPYARLVADPMAKALGQAIIVEYKPGPNGNSSAQFIADQPAEGPYVWIVSHPPPAITPSAFHIPTLSI